MRRLRTEATYQRLLFVVVLVAVAVMPLFFAPANGFVDSTVTALIYVVMALGLNIVVGFAGLLDLGYVAFYAIGSYTVGWLASGFFVDANVHVGAAGFAAKLPGVHLNFLLVIVAAIVLAALAGVLIGLPTLRLRGDYIAIVTLAFGEIVRIFALNGDSIGSGSYHLTGGRQGITPIDRPVLPGGNQLGDLNLRPWYWIALGLVLIVLFCNVRLRDSRLGRAWIAIREDEVAAASMGVPLVRTKLLAYASGAAFGGIAGVFLSSYQNTVNADSFQFSFSIFILAMIILGGLGSVWGVVLGAVALSYIDTYFIPNVLKSALAPLGLDVTALGFGIFGFLLVIMMILRPEGLFPERRRKIELTEGAGADDTIVEVHA